MVAAQGSMSAALNASVRKMRIVTKRFHTPIDAISISTAATASNETPLGIGTQFVSTTAAFQLRHFLTSTSGVAQTYDQYRFKEIEVFVRVLDWTNTPQRYPICLYGSVDQDDTVLPVWDGFSQRGSIMSKVMTTFVPACRLGAWKPTANFITAAGDAPSNIIPDPNAWFDMAQLTQSFNGIKIMAFSQGGQFSFNIYARATIEFKGQI